MKMDNHTTLGPLNSTFTETNTTLLLLSSTDFFQDNATQLTNVTTDSGVMVRGRIIASVFTVALVLATASGNMIVLLAFILDRKLAHQNHFNYYIINLAITDLSVPLLSSWLYMVDTLLGYWPFGEVRVNLYKLLLCHVV